MDKDGPIRMVENSLEHPIQKVRIISLDKLLFDALGDIKLKES